MVGITSAVNRLISVLITVLELSLGVRYWILECLVDS